MTADARRVSLAWCRILLGSLFLLRTTPVLWSLHIPYLRDTVPLLGWPRPGWRVALGFTLSAGAVAVLCMLRTLAAIAFTLGIRARISGLVASLLGYLVLAQDALALINTLHLLFLSTLLISTTEAGTVLALWRDPERPVTSGLRLIHCFVASIYWWSGLAKLHSEWLRGDTLAALFREGAFHGSLAAWLLGTPGRRAIAAWLTALVELALGPSLLWRRLRSWALMVALAFHGFLELTMHPDFFGFVMTALLVAFVEPAWFRYGGQAPDQRALASGQTKSP